MSNNQLLQWCKRLCQILEYATLEQKLSEDPNFDNLYGDSSQDVLRHAALQNASQMLQEVHDQMEVRP